MKEKIIDPYGFIYITTNMVNGKRYIGQKVFQNFGGKKWINYLGSGEIFKKALKRYGQKNFHRDIVTIAYSKEELDNLEIEWIKNYNAVKDKNFYNISHGGEGGNTGNIEKMKQTQINNNHTRKIYQLDKNTYEIIKKFDSIALATKQLRLSRSSIKNVLNPNYNSLTAGGFAWKYTDEENIKYADEYKQNKINKTRKHNKTDKILELYDNGLNFNEIHLLGYSNSTIRDVLKKYRGYITKEILTKKELLIRNNNIVELYLKGYKNCEIEKVLDLSRSVVQKAITKYKNK